MTAFINDVNNLAELNLYFRCDDEIVLVFCLLF